MKGIIATSALLSSAVSASNLWPKALSARAELGLGAAGFEKPGSFIATLSDNETLQANQVFEEAGRNPNETTSTTFNFAPGTLSGDSTWAWRINITDVAVPDGILDKDGMRVVNSQLELQWPGGGNLGSFVQRAGLGNETNTEMCVTAVDLVAPKNVTKHYSGPGECSDVLGKECTEKLLQQASTSGCSSTPRFIQPEIEECRDVLIDERPAASLAFTMTFGNASSNHTLQSGDTFFYDTSSAVQAANISETYEQAQRKLNILLMQAGAGMQAAMACQIVNEEAASSGMRLGGSGHLSVLVAGALGLALTLL